MCPRDRLPAGGYNNAELARATVLKCLLMTCWIAIYLRRTPRNTTSIHVRSRMFLVDVGFKSWRLVALPTSMPVNSTAQVQKVHRYLDSCPLQFLCACAYECGYAHIFGMPLTKWETADCGSTLSTVNILVILRHFDGRR